MGTHSMEYRQRSTYLRLEDSLVRAAIDDHFGGQPARTPIPKEASESGGQQRHQSEQEEGEGEGGCRCRQPATEASSEAWARKRSGDGSPSSRAAHRPSGTPG